MKKNNYSYIGIAFIILLFGILFIPKIVDRISNNDVTRNESRSNFATQKEKKAEPLSYIEINGERKKVPPFSFTNQNGDTITNTDYEGKVYVVEFFFATCPTICPRMSKNLVTIQDTFKNEANFGIASFTINPEHDTPEVLKNYAESYGISSPNWHLMTGNKTLIYKLSNEGFNLYTAEDTNVAGGFEHSGNFALIDKNGFIRSRNDAFGNPLIYYNGVISETQKVDDDGNKEEISALKQDIKQLLNE